MKSAHGRNHILITVQKFHNSFFHFSRRFIGKRDRQDMARRYFFLFDQISHPIGESFSFSRTRTSNNQNCASLTGTMQLAGPQPNPAITNSLLGIILPQAGTVYISIIDELGRPVVPEKPYNLAVGRTNYIIPVAQLQGAEYYIRVRYNDDIEVRNFVVK